MTSNPKRPGTTGAPIITVERTYNAPLDGIWDLWTTEKSLESWWGPEEFTLNVRNLDVGPGGGFEYAHDGNSPDPG